MKRYSIDNQQMDSIPIHVVNESEYLSWLAEQSETANTWLQQTNFLAKPGHYSLLPNHDGKLHAVLFIPDQNNFLAVGKLIISLPAKRFHFVNIELALEYDFAMAWGLSVYQYEVYKKSDIVYATLQLSSQVDFAKTINMIESIYLVRDLINTPSESLGPHELAIAAKQLANECGARFKQIVGNELLSSNFPAIHAIGRASDNLPRLIELQWGEAKHTSVTLVGKGVCFDTGGLNLKTGDGMRLMKKDMGGAAHVLGLARLIMMNQLPIHLTVLIPAVENVVAGNALKPGDVISSRKGLSIEIGNTDAEGRVILADALSYAAKPDLLIDFATLTGAARIAVGTEIAAFFTNDDELADQLMNKSKQCQDPLWRLPLYAPYKSLNESSIADITNSGKSYYAGASTAALFLEAFVEPETRWVHFDVMAWNVSGKPGKPEGGEAMGIRAVYAMLEALC